MPTPQTGYELAAFSLVKFFFVLAGIYGELKKLSGSLFLYEPLFCVQR